MLDAQAISTGSNRSKNVKDLGPCAGMANRNQNNLHVLFLRFSP